MSSPAHSFYGGYQNWNGFSPARPRRYLQYAYDDRVNFNALPPPEYLTSASIFKDDDGFIEDVDTYAERIGAEVINMLAHRNTFSEDLDGIGAVEGKFSF